MRPSDIYPPSLHGFADSEFCQVPLSWHRSAMVGGARRAASAEVSDICCPPNPVVLLLKPRQSLPDSKMTTAKSSVDRLQNFPSILSGYNQLFDDGPSSGLFKESVQLLVLQNYLVPLLYVCLGFTTPGDCLLYVRSIGPR